MQDDVVKAYPSRPQGSRNAWYDLTSYFYDYEAYYPPALQDLWQSILKARPSFPEKLKPLGSFWEADKSKAFKDLSKGGWFGFWSERLIPQDTLTRNDFYVSDKDDTHLPKIQWETLYQCEQMIGRYVLEREEDVKTQRHNHPINFFYADVKRICNILAEETSPHETRALVADLTTYIRNVRQTIESQSHDGFFIDKLLRFVGGDVHRELDAGIEHASLKGDFEKLQRNVGGLKRKVKRILHLGGDKPVPAHPPLQTPDNHIQSNPTQAMIECAKKISETSTSTALMEKGSAYALKPNALLVREGETDKPNTALLASCEGAPIAPTADKTRQENYLKGLSYLEKLNYHFQLINGILTLFNDAGHINMVLRFSGKLFEYLSVLQNHLSQAQADLNQYLEGNRVRSQQLFLKSENEGWFGERLTKEEKAFLANQKTLEQLQYTTIGLPGIEQVLKDIHEVSYHLTDLSRKYQDAQIQQEKVELLTDISEAITVLKSGEETTLLEIDAAEMDTPVIVKPRSSKPTMREDSLDRSLIQSSPTESVLSQTSMVSSSSAEPCKQEDSQVVQAYMNPQYNITAVNSMEAALAPSLIQENAHTETVNRKPAPSVVSDDLSLVAVETQPLAEESGEESTFHTHELTNCSLQIKEETGEVREVCIEPYARTTIIPKLIDGKLPEDWSLNDPYHCHRLPRAFEGESALYCEADNTVAYVQFTPPQKALQWENRFNQLGGQLALGAVFYQMGKSLINWWTTKPETITLINEADALPLIREANANLDAVETINLARKQSLRGIQFMLESDIPLLQIKKELAGEPWWPEHIMIDSETFTQAVKARVKDVKWVTELIEDHRIALASHQHDLNKHRLSDEALKETHRQTDYLLKYVTVIEDKTMLRNKQAAFISRLSQVTHLDETGLNTLEDYFKHLSHLMTQHTVTVSEERGNAYAAIRNVSALPSDILLEVAEMIYMIQQLSNNDAPLRESDIVDTEDELEKLFEKIEDYRTSSIGEQCLTIEDEELDMLSIFEEDLRLLRNRRYNVWLPISPSISSSQFFVPPPIQSGPAHTHHHTVTEGDRTSIQFRMR